MKDATNSAGSGETLEAAMRKAVSQRGKSLWDLSHESPLLVIFLRHFG